MTKKSVSPFKIPSARSQDQPASRKLLSLVRDELRSEIRSTGLKMDTRIEKLDARVGGLDTRFERIDARFEQVDARFEKLDARIGNIDLNLEEMKADGTRMRILLEEQTSNNRIVLEGLQALWQRQDRIERRLP